MRRRRKHGIAEAAATLPLRLFAFDVLYADGERVAEWTYAERHALLGWLIHAGATIQVAPSRTVGTAEELLTVFDAALGAGLEGIVAKKLAAPYQAGARNDTWVKLKRVQAGHLHCTGELEPPLGRSRGGGGPDRGPHGRASDPAMRSGDGVANSPSN